jgi:hypothetical protein
MTTMTTLARNGVSLSYDVQAKGWYAYIDQGGYNGEQQAALVDGLMAAQREETDSLLPDGCTWVPRIGEVIGPAGVDLEAALAPISTGHHDDGLGDMMELACERVIARFDAIERKALGQ